MDGNSIVSSVFFAVYSTLPANRRRRGKVGGYIPGGVTDLLRLPSSDSGLSGLWLCGYTIFPGAGTLGNAMSEWSAVERIMKQ